MKSFKVSFVILVLIAAATQHGAAQNVGIGTATPVEKLDVNGGIRIGATENTAKGTIRWNELKNDFEGYNGSRWVSLTAAKATGAGRRFLVMKTTLSVLH